MGHKIILLLLFSLISLLVAGYYNIIPSPWLEESTRTLGIRDEFVKKSANILETEPER